MNATAFRYITDALTRSEALAMLQAKQASQAEREARVRSLGYPAYVTSAGWLGYSDEKVARLTREAVEMGFTHFKMKVGASRESNLGHSIIPLDHQRPAVPARRGAGLQPCDPISQVVNIVQ